MARDRSSSNVTLISDDGIELIDRDPVILATLDQINNSGVKQ